MELGDSGPFGAGFSGLADLREFSCAHGNRVSWPGAAGWAERSVSRPLLPVRNCRKGSITNLNPRPQIKSSRSAPGRLSDLLFAAKTRLWPSIIEDQRFEIADSVSSTERSRASQEVPNPECAMTNAHYFRRILWIASARPVSASASIKTPERRTSPLATSKRAGIWFKNFCMTGRFSMPMTES